MAGFTHYPLEHGLLEDHTLSEFPTAIWAWRDARLMVHAAGTQFGFVQEGPATLECESGTFELRSGMYFAVSGQCRLHGGSGLVVSRLNYHGFFHLGGPVEQRGRLRYIDGCSDSLLIPPVAWGDPCLNLLHLPPHTRQSEHTHPSLRVGIVIRGAGRCVLPDREVALYPGQIFAIRAEQLHCFHTDSSEMAVVAFHPDSDFGPTDERHPMINRTFVSENT